jgi:HD-like signal output (HDOD) protein
MEYWIAALAATAALGLVLFLLLRGRPRDKSPAPQQAPSPAGADSGPARHIDFDDGDTVELRRRHYELAFGKAAFPYSITGEHEEIVHAAGKLLEQAVSNSQYFPRRPMVLPKLLRAVRNDDSTKQELVEIIVQDPVITGDVLKLANSPFYRISSEPVDTIGRAIVLLGMDGLKSLISASIMQPVFQVPRGYFEDFSRTAWDQAFQSAVAAQQYARKTNSCDSFTAHLLGLVSCVSDIVLFRLTIDLYKRFAGILPRVEVFVRIIEAHSGRVTQLIVEDWHLGEHMQNAIAEYVEMRPVNEMNPLARALYVGRLAGTAALLVQHQRYDADEARRLMLRKGVEPEVFDAMWRQLVPDDDETT